MVSTLEQETRKLAVLEIELQHERYLCSLIKDGLMGERVKELESRIGVIREHLAASNPERQELCLEKTAPTKARTEETMKTYTLSDIRMTNSDKMFDFNLVKFEDLSKDVVLTAAKKILKVIFFTRHTCQQTDLEHFLPTAIIQAVYNKRSWARALSAIQSNLHNRTITVSIIRKIMIETWKRLPDYPKPEMTRAERMVAWDQLINGNSNIIRRMISPLIESIDWSAIEQEETHDAKVLYGWARACLITAADTAFQLQRDRLDSAGKMMGVKDAPRLSNIVWEHFPETQTWKKELNGIDVPLQPNFGRGSRIRMRENAKPTLLCLGAADEPDQQRSPKKVRLDYSRIN